MNGALIFCEILAGWTIAGAVQTSPDWVRIDYIDQNDRADFIIIHESMYHECYPGEELQ